MTGLTPAFAPLVVGAGWALVVVAVVVRADRRMGRRRLPAPPGPAPHPQVGVSPDAGRPVAGRERLDRVTRLGAVVRRLAPSGVPSTSAAAGVADVPDGADGWAGTDRSGRPRRSAADVAADRRAGWAALVGAGLVPLAPALAAVPLVWAVVAPVLAARRRRALVEGRLHDQLPDVVDLLALTASAGLPVGAALVALGRRPGGPVGDALGRAAGHIVRGGSTAEALGLLSATGPALRPLVEALAQHDRYGSPLLPALERVAIEARARRRRRAEEAARRLPVTLLLPLVLTVLPAFVLLTVVPLLAGSLGSLSLSPT